MTAARLVRIRSLALAIGGLAWIALIYGLSTRAEPALHSYLWAYLFWLSFPIGAIAILMMHASVGGSWGILIEDILQSAAWTVPGMVLLFLPIAVGAESLYPWAQKAVAMDPQIAHKHAYLNLPFFYVRAAGIFAIWCWQAKRVSKPGFTRSLAPHGGRGLVVWSLIVSIAAVDWLMSLEPHWYSTIYGAYIALGFIISAFALAIVTRAGIGNAPDSGKPEPDAIHDLANLLFAFLIVWVYLAFSQYLIIWSGNIPEEIIWFLHRQRGGWLWLAFALFALGFAAPFLLLLFRELKRAWRPIGAIAALVLATRPLEAFWLVEPAFYPGRAQAHWQDAAAWIAVGGVWVAGFTTRLLTRKRS